jgi:purine nucleosidase
MVRHVIVDGDWAGDEMQLAAVLLADPGVWLLGATAVFGNTTLEQVVENARRILHFLGATEVPVYPGAAGPRDSAPLAGDGAHGSDGIGNVRLPPSPAPRPAQGAVEFILEQLRRHDPGAITVTASGPLTNLAAAIERDPATMRRVRELIIMGGCTAEMPAADMPMRRGNITPHAEFNFYMAARDAATVLGSGLPILLLPMGCTHGLTVTPARRAALAAAFLGEPRVRDALLGMMLAPAELDRAKFDSDPVMHDVHCALALLHPDRYECSPPGAVAVSTAPADRGRTEFRPHAAGNTRVATAPKDPDALFAIVLESLVARLAVGRRARDVAGA